MLHTGSFTSTAEVDGKMVSFGQTGQNEIMTRWWHEMKKSESWMSAPNVVAMQQTDRHCNPQSNAASVAKKKKNVMKNNISKSNSNLWSHLKFTRRVD